MPEGRAPLGPERLLAFGYGVFVLAAGARSAVQLSLHAERAPLAYSLSALAALVYAVGFVLVLRAGRGHGRRAATLCCGAELVGVVVVGTAGVVDPDAFPDATVWSGFGAGYLLLPLVLPLSALLWLRSLRERTTQDALEASPG